MRGREEALGACTALHGWLLVPSACAAGRRHWPRCSCHGCATLASSAGGGADQGTRAQGGLGAWPPGAACWSAQLWLEVARRKREQGRTEESSSERRRASLACSWKKEKDQKNGKAAGGGRLWDEEREEWGIYRKWLRVRLNWMGLDGPCDLG